MTNVFNVFICDKHNRQKIEDYNLPVNIEVHHWEIKCVVYFVDLIYKYMIWKCIQFCDLTH